jgi:hypothetical protein
VRTSLPGRYVCSGVGPSVADPTLGLAWRLAPRVLRECSSEDQDCAPSALLSCAALEPLHRMLSLQAMHEWSIDVALIDTFERRLLHLCLAHQRATYGTRGGTRWAHTIGPLR